MRAGSDPASGLTEDADRLAGAIIAGFLIARLLFAYLLAPGIDESYTLAIARNLSLSYLDHPPLHQWIAHFAALALGEGAAARLPFIILFAATGWILYRLTRDLFGPRAATIALFSLNVAPFFFASAGSWVVPDGPLLFGLAVAAWALARLFFVSDPDRSRVSGLWLLAGVGLGLAGLSKYSAALSAAGLAAFILLAPKQRRWLRHAGPYVAAAVALAMTASGVHMERATRLGVISVSGRARSAGGWPQAYPVPCDGRSARSFIFCRGFSRPSPRAWRTPGAGDRTNGGCFCSASPCRRSLFSRSRRSGARVAFRNGQCPAGSSPFR